VKLTGVLLGIVMAAVSSVAGVDITDIIGKNPNDSDVQKVFCSNIVRRLSTYITTTYENSKARATTQYWYVVSSPNARSNEFWDIADGPVYPYRPFIEFDTEVGLSSDSGETIYSVEVFRGKAEAECLIESICSKLAIPITNYYSLTHIIDVCRSTSFADALWMPNTNKVINIDTEYSLEHNGFYSVTNVARGNLNVRLGFRKEKLEFIRLIVKRECVDQQRDNTPNLTNFDFSFLSGWNTWPMSWPTGAVHETSPPHKLSSRRFESGLRCYREMIARGFKRVRRTETYESPISHIESWYEVSGGGIRVRVVNSVSRATERREEEEEVRFVLLDVSGLKTLNGVSVPGDIILPATPDECCSMYKTVYTRQSFDEDYTLIVCENDVSFLYENNHLIRVLVGRYSPGRVIYHMRF